ncbi:MAG TPA: ABC transporter permease, partial [Candidatus Limnocylindrales bacterium]|nr:ABC transporter permease [Candidatus Limnocylindrales bacterium]
MRLLRNLSRRKLRTGLTVAGITIGIWALVVFSAMATKIDALVVGGARYYADKVLVSDGTVSGFGLPMRLASGDRIVALEGVAAVAPSVTVLAGSIENGVSFGGAEEIQGSPVGADKGLEQFRVRLTAGRELAATDEGTDVAVVGADVARKRGLDVGDAIELRGRSFTVVGVMEPTLTAPDSTIVVPFSTAQRLLHEDLPPIVRDKIAAEELVSQFIVYPAPGTDVEALARRIEGAVDHAKAMTGAEFDRTVGSSIAIFNMIVVGIGLISLVVGGLSIVNTIAMSVAERTREIGIRRAIGAGRVRVVREVVTEAGVIGLIGGLLGLGLATAVILFANEAGRSS